MSLMQEMGARALKLGVPLSVQMDVTYRCNERCVHCYLDHDDHGEMTTAEIKDVLSQLAEAGVFFLIFSGGEVFMRMDFFELVEYARSLMFCVKLKTNAFMIGEEEADRLAAAHLDSVQVSIYSHRPEVHDAITLLPRSLERSIAGIRRLRDRGVKVILANVLMRPNFQDYAGVKALAKELGAEFTIDPTITPMMDGDRSILSLGIEQEELQQVFRDRRLGGQRRRVLRSACWTDGRSGRDGHAPLQRRAFGLLHLALWRPISLRAVSAAERERAAVEVSRYLAAFTGIERSPLDYDQRPAGLFAMCTRVELYAVSGLGLHGRQYAGSVDSGLREVIRTDRGSVGRRYARRPALTA